MTAQWLFLVYMAGDNGKRFPDGRPIMLDLSQEGWSDLREMASIGSSDRVKVVVQFDTLDSRQTTPRFLVHGGGRPVELVDQVPSVNTGDPRSLTEFVVWATAAYSAERVALILWNHGTGWDEEDVYARYREVGEGLRKDRQRGLVSERPGRALFLSSFAEVAALADDDTRAICYDDSSMDFLDNADLDAALAAASQRTGRRVDLLGMDACLMASVEVAYAVRRHADVLVASEEVEHADGWPYARILGALTASPEMDAACLGRHIVDAFSDRYKSRTRTPGWWTLASLDLAKLEPAIERFGPVCEWLAERMPDDFNIERRLLRAQKDLRRFSRPKDDPVDLLQLLEILGQGGHGPLAAMAEEVTGHLEGKAIDRNWSAAGQSAGGLSIYLPLGGYSPFYDRQAFAKTGWGRVIRTLNRVADLGIGETQPAG